MKNKPTLQGIKDIFTPFKKSYPDLFESIQSMIQLRYEISLKEGKTEEEAINTCVKEASDFFLSLAKSRE